MYHPRSRAERRHNRETWRNRQRCRMLTWHTYIFTRLDVTDNNMWWAGKQSSAHGNRCMCHYEKTDRKYVRRRRNALNYQILDNLRSWS